MSNTKQLDLVSGEIVMLSSTESERQVLMDVCARHGLEKFSWQVMTNSNALRIALKEVYRGHMIRKSKEGYVVVREDVNDDGNDYQTERNYRVDDLGIVYSNEEAGDVESQVRQRVNELQGRLMSGVVTGHMSKLMMRYFSAVRMRPNGGAFFVPNTHLEKWNEFASDYVSSTNNTLHRITSSCDTNTASAVMVTATEDLEQRYKETLEELSEASKSKGQRRANKTKRLLAALDDIALTATNVSSAFGQASDIAEKIQKRIKVEKAIALIG